MLDEFLGVREVFVDNVLEIYASEAVFVTLSANLVLVGSRTVLKLRCALIRLKISKILPLPEL